MNSLPKLGRHTYHTIILDEVGMLRRHLLNKTCRSYLVPIIQKLKFLIKNATLVVMCQDGISLDDIQFFTEFNDDEATNRNNIYAKKFIKPIVLHPIKWTEDLCTASRNMFMCYKE